jgi:hypothetical protein
MITFYMSINVTYKTLKPHLPEIAKYIAQELDIDFHQVKVFSWLSSQTDYVWDCKVQFMCLVSFW